ncbi:mucin TcMUCII, putative [Trypanosoma cruzi marinkellei]|uniref:Mucin TcMUCII, putative n=1 Tax=Trypanosoma cruzi marinkellei TaxID=85056 RepID=K2MS25_TRYCR|nr:mucin TcMUCII, putative [Trypanosoma cruzi marinkellei]
MTTTCRLLCALLVLALCCCPSVFATNVEKVSSPEVQMNGKDTVQLPHAPGGPSATTSGHSGSSGLGPGLDKEKNAPGTSDSAGALPQSKGANVPLETEVKESARENINGTTAPGAPIPGDATNPGNTVGDEGGTTGPELQSDDTRDTAQGEDKSTTGTPSDTRLPADQTDEKAKDPTATTTTTTTTTAPEAPTTTTALEAPTMTTTRAPSRLREMDGSLSSSAWVCAPMLLAVSALAYTALG